MKKIMIIDGGPRKTMNTAKLIEAFIKGIKSRSEEIEIKHVRLYDYDYKGCYACLACKVKNSKYHDVCAIKDGITDVLKETAYADGLCIAAPIYFMDISAQTKAFIERLTYPWLDYNNVSMNPPKQQATATIYSMNDSLPERVNEMLDRVEFVLRFAFGNQTPERVAALNTMQVKNYDRYDFGMFPKEMKEAWHEEHWNDDLQKSFDAGKHMAEKILG